MARIYFNFRGSSETGKLTVRIKHSNKVDLRLSSPIVSKYRYWYNTNKKHRNFESLSYLDAEAKTHKEYLEAFKNELLQRFQVDYNNGVPISKEWFRTVVNEVTGILTTKHDINEAQSKLNSNEQERLIKEREDHEKNLVTSAINRVINIEYSDNKQQALIYNQLLNKINDFQKFKKTKFLTKHITQDFIFEFSTFLTKELKHQDSTARKHCKSLIHAVKYQYNAFSEIVKVSEGIRDIRYKRQSTSKKRLRRSEIVITLTFEELDQIHYTDVPERLIDAKKVILFGCEVGLRVADYGKLKSENIKEDEGFRYWSFWNQKTGTNVIIPITKRIERYIDAYGMPKTSFKKNEDVKINREIKEVCRLSGIDALVQGRKSLSVNIKGAETRRTVSMKYPKYELISTHGLRRSFATLYFNSNILSLYQIRQITGHKSNAQLLDYINEDIDRVEIVKEMTNKMNSKELDRKSTTLKLIKRETK